MDPLQKQVMLWNHKVLEYDYLVLANGRDVFWSDFGVEEAARDLELFSSYFQNKQNLDEELAQAVNAKTQILQKNLSNFSFLLKK